tara:strand:- start:119 stop:412 length:294 start_codon:yes stop_codon:yes gene_type:complete
MTTLKDFAKEFEPQQMKNIADLEVVRTDIEIKEETRKDREDQEYHVMFVVVDGEEYRVPPSVVTQIKGILEAKPKIASIKVIKSGQGLATQYQVIPL